MRELGWSGSSPGEGRLRRVGGWEQTQTHPNILGGKRARNSQAGRREARGEGSQKEGVDDSGEGRLRRDPSRSGLKVAPQLATERTALPEQ